MSGCWNVHKRWISGQAWEACNQRENWWMEVWTANSCESRAGNASIWRGGGEHGALLKVSAEANKRGGSQQLQHVDGDCLPFLSHGRLAHRHLLGQIPHLCHFPSYPHHCALAISIDLYSGLVACSLVTQLALLKPHGCGTITQRCDPHSKPETAIFYSSIYLIALGNGAPEPALATFGSDQFDEDDPEEKQMKNSFFSYFYVALNLGSLIAETVLVYLENMGHWVVGFWTSTACAMAALVLLLSGTLRYRHIKPSGNPVSRFAQVIVASFRKLELDVPSDGQGLYEFSRQDGKTTNGTRRMLHTHGFRFLDRAAVVSSSDMEYLVPASMDDDQKEGSRNPWRLCTVTQVEEVKCVLRLLPIWLCTILSSVVFIQMLSLFVEQGAAMETRLFGTFHFPPASMTTAFDIISTSLFIVFYNKLLLPFLVKLTKKEPKPPSELKRIGIGLAIAIVAMVIAAFVEQQRRKFAVPGKEKSTLSIFWQTPQYVLVGVSEAFVYVAQWEFFSSQTPGGLKEYRFRPIDVVFSHGKLYLQHNTDGGYGSHVQRRETRVGPA